MVTVTGSNDAAAIGGDATGAVTEDATETEASGTLTVSDPDAGQDTFTAQTGTEGRYGTFTLEADGTWSYTLDNEDEQTGELVAGETVTDTFAVASADGTVGRVVVTVTGSDDAAVIGGATTGSVTEDYPNAATAGGMLVVSDPDTHLTNQQRRFTAQTGIEGTYGTFTLEADGTWSYTLDSGDRDTNALGAGDTRSDRFSVVTAGGLHAEVVITVTGSNDAATIGGDATGSVTEDAPAASTAGGTLTVSDPDAGQDTFTAQTGTVGKVRDVHARCERSVELHAGRCGPGHRRAGCGRDGHGCVRGGERGRDGGAGGGHGDGVGRRGGDWRSHHGFGDGGRPERGDGGREAGRERPGFVADESAAPVHCTEGGSRDVRDVCAQGGRFVELHAGRCEPAHRRAGCGRDGDRHVHGGEQDGAAGQVVVTVRGSNDAETIGGDATGAVTEDAPAAATAGGTLTVSDPDAGQNTFRTQTGVKGYTGRSRSKADGTWTYTLDDADPDTDALGVGETDTDVFAVASAGGTTGQVVVTVTGSDDAAVIGGATTGAVTEDDATASTATRDAVGERPGYRADRRAAPVHRADGSPGDIRDVHARCGRSVELHAGRCEPGHRRAGCGRHGNRQVRGGERGRDGGGGGDRGEGVGRRGDHRRERHGCGDGGRLERVDGERDADGERPGRGAGHLQGADGSQGDIRTFTLGADGTWSYTLDDTDPDTDALGAGETDTDVFAVASAGGTTGQVVITVRGSNDAATIGGNATGTVTEDDSSAAAGSGTLTVSDPDAGQDTFKAQTGVKVIYGRFTLGADGTWTYTLDNADPDTNALVAGETETETFAVASADGTAGEVVVTVRGSDDAATIGGDATGAVTEDDSNAATASGTLTVSDPDAGQDTFTAQTGTVGKYGTFTLGTDGAWSYTLDDADPDTDALGAGETGTRTRSRWRVRTGRRGRVVVTVTGSDDAAAIGGDATGAVTEDDATASTATGTLVVSDPDTELTAEQRKFTAQTAIQGTYGTFTLGADGTWTYTLDDADPDTDALGAGETDTDTFAVASAGGTTGQVVVTVTGSDDAAVIGGDATGSVTEDDATASTTGGKLVVSDPDTELTAEQRKFTAQTAIQGTYGTFTLGADGTWTYTLDDADPDTDALGAGETDTDVFAVASVGGTTGRVVVTVTGSNDAAAIGGDATGAVTEDDATASTAGGTLTVSDPDAGQDSFKAQAGVKGIYGTFTLGADGAWSYTLDDADPDTDALGAGETDTDVFAVASADGTTGEVVITVTGRTTRRPSAEPPRVR